MTYGELTRRLRQLGIQYHHQAAVATSSGGILRRTSLPKYPFIAVAKYRPALFAPYFDSWVSQKKTSVTLR
jgi:hypothetical protein